VKLDAELLARLHAPEHVRYNADLTVLPLAPEPVKLSVGQTVQQDAEPHAKQHALWPVRGLAEAGIVKQDADLTVLPLALELVRYNVDLTAQRHAPEPVRCYAELIVKQDAEPHAKQHALWPVRGHVDAGIAKLDAEKLARLHAPELVRYNADLTAQRLAPEHAKLSVGTLTVAIVVTMLAGIIALQVALRLVIIIHAH
jgi:hypothetical protein